jgi:hypothetical protein
LRHTGKRNSRPGLFAQEQREGVTLAGAVMHSGGHPLKGGGAPGDGCRDVAPGDGRAGASNDDDQQAKKAVAKT